MQKSSRNFRCYCFLCFWLTAALVALALLVSRATSAAEPGSGKAAPAAKSVWPRFRGPNGSAVSDEKGIPVTWGEDDYLWTTRLPGVGHSCPVIWGDDVFVTSAEEQGQNRSVYCLSAATGKIKWSRSFNSQTNDKHDLNSFASSSPATDGQRVYVSFGNEAEYALIALDFQGSVIWDRRFGPFIGQHGSGVSPIVHDGIVYLANDQDGPSSLHAVDAQTGETRWEVKRRSAEQSAAYATPFVLERPGMPTEIVFSSRLEGIAAYDAKTGQRHWSVGPLDHRAVSSPAYGHGLIFQTCGGGGSGKYMAALRPTGFDKAEIVWTRQRQLPYVPTPVVYGNNLYLWGDRGLISCVEATTGKNIWTGRVDTVDFSGSPICIDGKLYCMSRDGDVWVVGTGAEFELLAKNSLGDPSHATPAVADGRLFLRTFHGLYCLGRTETAEK